jgi:formylglycine-generating enzyme required for sulfatase activity/uncharacterized protein YceK
MVWVLPGLALLGNGCASIGSRFDREAPRECYLGTQRDLAGVQAPFDETVRNDPQGGAAWIWFPFAVIDLPLSFALDTVCLPYDIVRTSTGGRSDSGNRMQEPCYAKKPGFGEPKRKPIPLVWIEPGTFETVVRRSTNRDWDSTEPAVRRVTISRGYWIGKYEITQREFLGVVFRNPSGIRGDLDRPVESVSWYEATNFCHQLTQREFRAGRLPEGYAYRLPTEAEWEYACRAGSSGRFSWGDELDEVRLAEHAWYAANSGVTRKTSHGQPDAAVGEPGMSHPVGRKQPNAWGLHDGCGNVWEWCLDAWVEPLPEGDFADPQSRSEGTDKADRGGGWDTRPEHLGATARVAYAAGNRSPVQGFRVVLAPVR